MEKVQAPQGHSACFFSAAAAAVYPLALEEGCFFPFEAAAAVEALPCFFGAGGVAAAAGRGDGRGLWGQGECYGRGGAHLLGSAQQGNDIIITR